jgi:hypothetical protein
MDEDDDFMGDSLRNAIVSLPVQLSDRRFRLFAVACCDAISQRFPHPLSAAAVRCAERFADGEASAAELKAAQSVGAEAYQSVRSKYLSPVEQGNAETHADAQPDTRATLAAVATTTTLSDLGLRGAFAGVADELCPAEARRLLRCFYGEWHPAPAFSPSWRSETAVALASAIYAERAFDRLPILADALEEAGCDHPDILSHCRGPGPHARGCWVVDGVLDKQ